MDSLSIEINTSKSYIDKISAEKIGTQAVSSACISIALHLCVFALLANASVPTQPEPRPDAPPIVLQARLVSANPQPKGLTVNTQDPDRTSNTIEHAPVAPQKTLKNPKVRPPINEALAPERLKNKRRDMKADERMPKPLTASQDVNTSNEEPHPTEHLHRLPTEDYASPPPITPPSVRVYRPVIKQAPEYPRRARERGIEGDCTVEYTVTINGTIEKPFIIGKCHTLFVQPSLNAAKKFRYEPQIVNGQAQTVMGVRNTFLYRMAN